MNQELYGGATVRRGIEGGWVGENREKGFGNQPLALKCALAGPNSNTLLATFV
jgi:hypothetical protein